ncbi:MAG: hypothetical protein A2660_02740 [Candidatus Doudnabacteria bacterium RIFCSPHIGHO2_01_FULL_45_18]|uniref:GlcNAc-PI de-N-acetylase n=1 Tax=Candidatus Doudnabacteria bacterium RIFCSPHIGHO2_01_FULL_45_18 TaxID=1817823 RepID=A0A1F5NQU6_9BACT|nr:MAG: hypothetical protein A2660_02740 [Candidatus Doudnabacteria bacterium RIFCSPHIGHO2_01_FULL_45_18]
MKNMRPKNNSLYALAIIAHPDDEAFLLAGTSLKFADENKTVGVVCVTRGEKGADRLHRNLRQDQIAKIRTKELQAACKILGCECKQVLDYPDGALDQADFEQLVGQLTEIVNHYQPQVVLTFGEEGIAGHKDHITIGLAAVAACKKAGLKPAEIWLSSIPSSLIQDYETHMEKRKVHHSHFAPKRLMGVPDEKLSKIDIHKYKDLKLKAIEAHQSQYLQGGVWPEALKSEWFEIVKLT